MEVLLAACCIGATGGTLLWSDGYLDAAADVVADGDIAYMALTTSGVLVVNMSNPKSPSVLGRCQVPGSVTSIRYSKPHVYVVNDNALFIISVRDPSSPVVVGNDTLDDPWNRPTLSPIFDVERTTVYLTSAPRPGYQTSIYAVDVSDPTSPESVAGFSSSMNITGMTVSGSYMYLAVEGGLIVFETYNLRRVTSIDVAGTQQSILVADRTAYVGSSDGFHAYRITSNPDPSLTPLGSVGPCFSSPPTSLFLVDDTLYAAAGGEGGGVCAVDMENPGWPTLLGNITSDTCGGVSSIGSSVLLACGKGMLQVFDVTYPKYPRLVAQTGEYGEAVGIHGAGSLVAVADAAHNTVRVFNVSDPAEPELLSTVTPRAGVVARPFVLDTQVFVGTTEGLEAYDVTVPKSPQFMWGNAIGDTRALWVEGRKAYVGGSRGVFRILDVSGAAPQVVGDLHSVGSVVDVTVVGDIAYLGSSQGLLLVNMSTQQPTLIRSAGAPDVQGVSVSGSWAYLVATSSKGGPRVVDISDPRTPVLHGLGSLRVSDTRGIDVVGTAAYAVDYSAGLLIVDAADPTDLVLFGTVLTDGGATALYAVGTTVYVAARGLRVIEASEIPSTPQDVPLDSGSSPSSDGTLVWLWVPAAIVILALCVGLCLLAKMKLSKKGVDNNLIELESAEAKYKVES